LRGVSQKAVATWLALAFALVLLAACGGGNDKPAAKSHAKTDPLLSELAPAGWANAAATFVNAKGDEVGHAVMTNAPGGVLLRVDLKGLAEGWHGIHFHNVGDCADGAAGFKASEGHIDPDERMHGLLHAEGPERADLPNIYAGSDGRATAELFRAGIALLPSEAAAAATGPFPLLDDDGFAIIIHENPDDHRSQPIGGAAARVACAAFGSKAQQ
jgi:Cu-Zn family superoxide dismutase